MATTKKWETYIPTKDGKFWINIHDIDEHIQVTFIYADPIKAMKLFAKEVGFKFDKKWTNYQCYKELYGYINKNKIEENNNFAKQISIDCVPEDSFWARFVYSNSKEGLRLAAKAAKFKYDDSWSTRQFARKLIDFCE